MLFITPKVFNIKARGRAAQPRVACYAARPRAIIFDRVAVGVFILTDLWGITS